MSYSGSDLVRSSVTGSSLGRSGKLTKWPIDGSRDVWPAQRPNEGEKAGSPDKLHRFEWTEQRRDIVRNISILNFLLVSVSMWNNSFHVVSSQNGNMRKKSTHAESFLAPGRRKYFEFRNLIAFIVFSVQKHIEMAGFPL